MKRRKRSHNYRKPGTYLLTINVLNRRPLFGNLVVYPSPRINLSPLGDRIVRGEIPRISYFYPEIEVYKTCVMPDHLHLIVRLNRPLHNDLHLGNVVAGFKLGCHDAYTEILGPQEIGLFEEGYNDRILYHKLQLKAWKKYVADNPKRLAIKRAHPELFHTLYNMNVVNRNCQGFGNIYLLDIPDKEMVQVHHDDSDEVYQAAFKRWMACGERGGVLVSAAVAKRERDVINEAIARGYPVIRLRDMGFSAFYKPGGIYFDACAAGDLLELSPWEYQTQKKEITRKQCDFLNAMARDIANMFPKE